MKKSKIIIALFVLAMLSSCKDFLEIAPLSQTNSLSFYKKQSDIEQALNAAYAAHRGIYVGRTSGLPPIFQLEDVRADDYGNGNAGDAVVGGFEIDGGSEWYRWNWSDTYYAINACNTVIDRAPAVEMDNTYRNRLIAEARFLRGHTYFLMVQDYGGVPLVLKETTSFEASQINIPRSSVAETYTQIVADLDFAAANLPQTYTGADIGRATWGAAKGMLGKVYLQSGNAGAAAAALKEVVNSGLYSLLPDYWDVFSPSNHNHAESLFEIQHKANFAGSPYGNVMATPNWGGIGAGYNYDLPANEYLAMFDPADLRQQNLFATDVLGNKYCVKYLDPGMTSGFNGDTDFPVLRYADVLLLLAEAVGEGAEAYGYINQVRTRAGLPDIDGSTPGTFIDKVLNERRFELSFELHRWHDILRQGSAYTIKVMNDYFAAAGQSIVIDDHDLLHAIPVSVIQATKGIVAQNPGYPSGL